MNILGKTGLAYFLGKLKQIFSPISHTHTVSEISNIGSIMKIKYYPYPSTFGATNESTLEEIVTLLPNYSKTSFWVNATTAYPNVYPEIAAAALTLYGMNEGFGNVTITKSSNTTRVVWEHYKSLKTMVRNHSDINEKGWSNWGKVVIDEITDGVTTDAVE